MSRMRKCFNTGNVKNTSTKFDKYYKMYDLALKLYQNNINSHLGKNAIEYLEKRKISKDLIKEFKIGLAIDKDALTKVLTKKEIEEDELDLTEIILDTDKVVDPLKRKLVEIINKAINDEATLSDIIDVVLKNKKRILKDKKDECDCV